MSASFCFSSAASLSNNSWFSTYHFSFCCRLSTSLSLIDCTSHHIVDGCGRNHTIKHHDTKCDENSKQIINNVLMTGMILATKQTNNNYSQLLFTLVNLQLLIVYRGRSKSSRPDLVLFRIKLKYYLLLIVARLKTRHAQYDF